MDGSQVDWAGDPQRPGDRLAAFGELHAPTVPVDPGAAPRTDGRRVGDGDEPALDLAPDDPEED